MSKCDIFVTWLDPLKNGRILLICLVGVFVIAVNLGIRIEQGDMGVVNANKNLVIIVLFCNLWLYGSVSRYKVSIGDPQDVILLVILRFGLLREWHSKLKLTENDDNDYIILMWDVDYHLRPLYWTVLSKMTDTTRYKARSTPPRDPIAWVTVSFFVTLSHSVPRFLNTTMANHRQRGKKL